MSRLLHILVISAFSLSVTVSVLAADKSANEGAKELGKKGIYGKTSLEPEGEQVNQEAQKKVAEEERKRREAEKQKYPLSITGQTRVVQSAHQHLLNGMVAYNNVSGIFSELYNSSAATSTTASELTQSDLAKQRLELLRILSKEMNIAVAEFSSANGLTPNQTKITKWLKAARTGQKVLDFHLKFNQILTKAEALGLDDEKIVLLAQMWAIKDKENNKSTKGKFSLPQTEKQNPFSNMASTSSYSSYLPGLNGQPMGGGGK